MSGSHEILKKASRYTVRTCLPAAPENMAAIAAKIKDKKISRVGVVVADYAWGHSLREAVEALIKPLPGVKLQMEVAPVPEKDFTPYLRKLQGLDPELIIATGHPPGVPTITRQAIELGMKAQIIGPWFPPEVMAQRVGDLMFDRFVDYSCVDFEHQAFKQLAERYNATYKRMWTTTLSPIRDGQDGGGRDRGTKSADPKVVAEAIRKGSFTSRATRGRCVHRWAR